MANTTLAKLLVIFLLFLSSARFIFVRHIGNDALAIVPIIALFISVTNILVFGISIEEIAVLVASLLACVWNFQPIIRRADDVIIDKYDGKFKILSLLSMVIATALGALIVYFRPMKPNEKRLNATESVMLCKGNFSRGFSELSEFFRLPDAKIWRMEPADGKYRNFLGGEGRTIVLMVPPKTSSPEIYNGFMRKLAHDGFTVYLGEFYCDSFFTDFRGMRIFRRPAYLSLKARKETYYKAILESNRRRLAFEFEALYALSSPSSDDQVFLVGEDDIANAMLLAYENLSDRILGFLDLADTEYTTAGYGPIENTDPVRAALLFKLPPDRSGYISNHLALEVEKFIATFY